MAVELALLTEETRDRLCEAVRNAYSSAARQPEGTHPFPVGREFAASLGYPPGLLDSSPSVAVEAFAGVSNVAVFADIPEGANVLDLGCGAGLDALIAAGRVGARGRVLGVDFSEAMLTRARRAAIGEKVEFLVGWDWVPDKNQFNLRRLNLCTKYAAFSRRC